MSRRVGIDDGQRGQRSEESRTHLETSEDERAKSERLGLTEN
jgi:hypothetical protein